MTQRQRWIGQIAHMKWTSFFRHLLRSIGQRFPVLRRYSGRLGLGRLVTAGAAYEQIVIDDDVVIELDLSVPIYRHIYFHHNISAMPETQLIRLLSAPSGILVDVGANIGYFALIAAKYWRHVYAFEPSYRTFAMLARNIRLNPLLAPKVDAFQLALSDHTGQSRFFNSAQHPDLGSLRAIPSGDALVENVEVDTLDRVLQDVPVAFMKIDVEGGELDVLNGGRSVIDRHQPLVLCEMFEPFQKRFGHTCRDIADFFLKRDYEGFRVLGDQTSRGQVRLNPLDVDQLRADEAENALFVPSARVGQVMTRLPA